MSRSFTEIVYKFHGDDELIKFTVPTYVVNTWIDERTPINIIRRLGYVVEFKEFTMEEK